MTREHMDTQLQRLVVLKGMPGETDGYFDALQDIPEGVFSAAVGHALKTRAWFPTPAEIRLDCDAVRRVVPPSEIPHERPPVDLDSPWVAEIRNPFGGKSIYVNVYEHWEHHCSMCSDTGMAVRWCGPRPEGHERMPWVPSGKCARRKPHLAHDWAETCVCVDTNPTIRRRKEAAQQYAQEPAKVRA